MKIISKFKDYYDYLQGIYGIDELLVLDRTQYFKTQEYKHKKFEKISFQICDYLVEGLIYNGIFIYGKEISDIFNLGEDKYDTYSLGSTRILKQPLKIDKNKSFNIKEDCPILIMIGNDDYDYHNWRNGRNNFTFEKFPILKDYNFIKVFKPEQIWKMLSEWLGEQKDAKIKQKPLTDKELIVSNGFDLKTSFRGK